MMIPLKCFELPKNLPQTEFLGSQVYYSNTAWERDGKNVIKNPFEYPLYVVLHKSFYCLHSHTIV